ncbi:hypothetical protein DE146DRAFT_645081 [Phaeosphaeria sp. MPI-PUGE-AT-0046c]|nr:hypothetical protein DE146DRAFT_645081 [Phaeosphaeria sp. MPI-PUGE-AT-0046c]
MTRSMWNQGRHSWWYLIFILFARLMVSTSGCSLVLDEKVPRMSFTPGMVNSDTVFHHPSPYILCQSFLAMIPMLTNFTYDWCNIMELTPKSLLI